MSKLVGMLVALAMFCAMPALAFAQDEGENVSSGNTQDADVDQEGEGGGNAVGGSGEGDGDSSGGGSGGDAAGGAGNVGNQAAICQQNAGEDAVCNIDQSQSFGGDTIVTRGGGHARHHGVVSVRNVQLARTGFDAWMLAAIGGIVLVGGLGLLAAQRRGRLDG